MRGLKLAVVGMMVLTASTAWSVNLEDRVLALEAQVAALESTVSTLNATVTSLNNTVANLDGRLQAVEGNTALQLDGLVSVNNSTINEVVGPHVIIEGANLHLRSGQGYTFKYNHDTYPPNGLGNLIIGYNETPAPALRTGSHNLVLGYMNGFPGYGAFVQGDYNWADDFGATIAGFNNSASRYAAVVGGMENVVSNYDWAAVIIGGSYNYIWGETSTYGSRNGVIVGGAYNEISPTATAWSKDNVLIGGVYNTAEGDYNVQIGGDSNSVSGTKSVELGGVGQSEGDSNATLLDPNYHIHQ